MGDEDGREPRPSFFRRVGRGARTMGDGVDVLEILLTLGRVIAWPIRFVARWVDALW